MTSMSGADADALERVGVQLERAGVDLRTRGHRLQRAINASPWHGSSADRFRHDFATVHMRAIDDAARFLDDAKEALQINARQQREASGITSSRSIRSIHLPITRAQLFSVVERLLGGTAKGATDLWRSVSNPLHRLARIDSVAGALLAVGGGSAVAGRYTNAWRSVISHAPSGLGDLLKFKQSPVLHAINKVVGPGSKVLTTVDTVLKPVGHAVTAVGAAQKGWDGIQAVRSGDGIGAGLAGADLAATGLKGSKNPVAYLGGVAVSAWSEAGKAARGVDWSPEGLRLITTASPKNWIDAFGEGTIGAAKRLPDILL